MCYLYRRARPKCHFLQSAGTLLSIDRTACEDAHPPIGVDDDDDVVGVWDQILRGLEFPFEGGQTDRQTYIQTGRETILEYLQQKIQFIGKPREHMV